MNDSRQEARGRVLKAEFPKFGLQRNDRIEPTLSQPNIANFDPESGVRETLWWRGSKDTLARRRNPLLCEATGLSLDNFAQDWLHVLSLGVFCHALGYFCWALFAANAFDVHAGAAQQLEVSVSILRGLLFRWYSEQEKQGRRPNRAQALTSSMFGDRSSPFLGLHGGETNSFLRFAYLVLLPRYRNYLESTAASWEGLLASCIKELDLIREHPRRLPPHGIQSFCDSIMQHLRCLDNLGIPQRPKHHQLMEMGVKSGA